MKKLPYGCYSSLILQINIIPLAVYLNVVANFFYLDVPWLMSVSKTSQREENGIIKHYFDYLRF